MRKCTHCQFALALWTAAILFCGHPEGLLAQANSSDVSATATNLVLPDLNSLLNNTNAAIPRDATASAREMSLLDNKQKLGFGDRISFRVIEDQEDAKELFVSEGGDLDIPYIGLVPAKDRTCFEVAADAKKLLEKEYYYQATVILSLVMVNKNRTMGRVYVTGQVKIIGPQDIPGNEVYTVSKAILKAGGFGDFADKRKVRLVRKAGPDDKEKKTFIINVAEIYEKGKIENDVTVEADDLIYVPGRLINF